MTNIIEEELKASTLVTIPEVMVCGVKLSCKLDMTEYAALEDYEKANDLIGLRAKFDRFQRDIKRIERESYPPEYRALQKEIENLQGAQEEKFEARRKNPAVWGKADRKYIADLEDAIGKAQIELESIALDDVANIQRLDEQSKKLVIFGQHLNEFYLPFAHQLASSRGLTKNKLDTWQKKAVPADFSASSELVRLGKARHNSDLGKRPLPEPMTSKN